MIREPTEYEARNLLLSSGIRFEDKGHYYSIRCPFHKNGMEKQASAALYKANWFFKCFTCGESMPFHRLYQELKHEPWNEHGTIKLVEKDLYERRVQQLEKERSSFEIIAGKITEVYDNAKALAYCRSRSLSDAFIKEFKIRATDLCQFKNKKLWHDRLLIPIYYQGKLYSLEGRDYLRTQTPKCLYPKDAQVSICFNQDNLRKDQPLVVCEGLMDIPKVWEYVTKNTTVTFGVSLAQEQKDFLKDCKNLILFIDDDKAGHSSIDFFEDFMEYDFKVARVHGKDPGDSTPEEIEYAISHAKPFGEFVIEESGLFNKEKFSLY